MLQHTFDKIITATNALDHYNSIQKNNSFIHLLYCFLKNYHSLESLQMQVLTVYCTYREVGYCLIELCMEKIVAF